MQQALKEQLQKFVRSDKHITVLTGAGISAESGIPTFRGPEGYWTVGSKEYHPQEMATRRMFTLAPDEVWKWYLYRFNVCSAALPNPGHYALVEMEKIFGNRFTLITQNVDGLHIRAGNSMERTFHIHGNAACMRCFAECSRSLWPVPEIFRDRPPSADLGPEEIRLLTCPDCGSRTRPHVLWFDEIYNEHFFRFESSLRTARKTDLLIIVGTSGVTNLPNQVVAEVGRHGGLLIDINIAENPFSQYARKCKGYFLQNSAAGALPEMMDIFRQ
ncbi:MAG: Sir2 family NAD-dependent protein deacetylase [Desulfococcaceae bacterium]|jgi:NAD-dependent deacetylase|nr:Sir2 family NAD-dependent protein deacetylase [Desulfococcaceae bacterium]